MIRSLFDPLCTSGGETAPDSSYMTYGCVESRQWHVQVNNSDMVNTMNIDSCAGYAGYSGLGFTTPTPGYFMEGCVPPLVGGVSTPTQVGNQWEVRFSGGDHNAHYMVDPYYAQQSCGLQTQHFPSFSESTCFTSLPPFMNSFDGVAPTPTHCNFSLKDEAIEDDSQYCEILDHEDTDLEALFIPEVILEEGENAIEFPPDPEDLDPHHNNPDLECQIYPTQFVANLRQCITTRASQRKRKHKLGCPKKRIHNCKICGRPFTNVTSAELHVRTHCSLQELKYSGVFHAQCPHCSKMFFQRQNFQDHVNAHEGRKEHSCPICKKFFLTKVYMLAHFSTHYNLKKKHDMGKDCECCGDLSFSKPKKPKKPSDSDILPTSLTCDICNKTFSHRGGLGRHKLLHLNPRPFSCVECNKSFTQFAHLTRHYTSNAHLTRNQIPVPARKKRTKKVTVIKNTDN